MPFGIYQLSNKQEVILEGFDPRRIDTLMYRFEMC